MAAGRIGIEIAADEAEFLDAAFELADAGLRIDAGRLRQLAHADEIVRIEVADAVDQLVADLRPHQADAGIADVMGHAHRARRKDGQIGAALALEPELGALNAGAQFVVADAQRRRRRPLRRILQRRDLTLAEIVELVRFGRVMTVAVDDHTKTPDAGTTSPRPGQASEPPRDRKRPTAASLAEICVRKKAI